MELGQSQQDDMSDSSFRALLFLGVNSSCFLIYVALSVTLLLKLKGIRLDRRSYQIMFAYALSFLSKSLCGVTI